MSLTYNSIQYHLDDHRYTPMNIYTFIATFKYDINKLYIDKFLDSIDRNAWIVVDYSILRWIGYSNAHSQNIKEKYLNILKEYFNDSEYQILSNTILVSFNTFTDSLFLLKTKQSKKIRKQLLLFKTVYMTYLKYCSAILQHNKKFLITQINR